MRMVFPLVLSFFLLLLRPWAGFAQELEDNQSHFTVFLFWEHLKYEENVPELDVQARSNVNNLAASLEFVKFLNRPFLGTRITTPLWAGDDQEDWTQGGTTFQTNSLQYAWFRWDGFVGYGFKKWLRPYLGVRWSRARQERSNFMLNGIPIMGTAVEKITSWYFLTGLRGNGKLTRRIQGKYRLEYFLPLNAEVENSALPGISISERDGYAFEMSGDIEYSFRNGLFFGFQIFGGAMHWNGSEWVPFNGGITKWPENDTYFFGAGLNLVYRF